MIIDQLFEDDKKKKLNEIDPRNYDSDWDYYNDRDAEDSEDDEDFDVPDDATDDMDNDEESYYEKSLRSRGLGEGSGESVSFREMVNVVDEHYPKYYAELSGSDISDEQFKQEIISTYNEITNKQGMAEGKHNKKRKLDEAWLMEDPVYRKFKVIGRYIVERKMSEKEILDIFAQVETGMTDKATGANRTFLGRGKDTTMDFAGGVADALKGVWGGIQNNVGVQAVDVAYDKATDALADLTGGQKGAVMQALKKYRMLAKEYPKTAGLAKGALVAITGLATGGAGLPAVAALVYGLDSAIKGEKFSDIALKAGGAAATAWAGQKLASAFGGDQAAAGAEAGGMGDPSQLPPFDDAGNLSPGFHISPDDGAPFYTGDLAPTPTDIAAGYGVDSTAGLTTGAETGASTGADIFGGGTYTIQKGDQLGYIAQANGVSVEDIRGINPQIDFSKPLQPGTEITLPVTGTPGEGSVWQSYQGGMYGDKAAGPELLGGPGAGDVASAATTAASTPASSPLSFDPATNSGTVTLPSGETIKASVFPQGGQFQPRLPVGGEMIKIPYGGQEVTGYVHNGVAYFPKFPADAAASATTSTAGTLSGVTGQQIVSSPVYQQVYAQEIAKWGAEPSARAIQAAQTIATAKAKAAMVGAVRESTDWINTVKMRRLPVDKMIDQKLTTLSWALNESVGKPQGRSMHLTPLGVYTVFENIRRVGEAAVSDLAPTTAPKLGDPGYYGKADPEETKKTVAKMTDQQLQSFTSKPGTDPKNPHIQIAKDELAKRQGGAAAGGAAGPGREELPDLYRPDAPDAPYTPADPAKKSWFGKGLDALDRGAKAVGGAISNIGHQLTTGVTKEKLKMNWHVAGKPTDSDQLSAWLVKQGVPIGVVNGVYSKMGLPVSAEPATPTEPAQTTPVDNKAKKELPWLGKDLTTNQNRTVDQYSAQPEQPASEVPVNPAPTTTTATTKNPTGFNASNIFKQPGMEKYAKPAPVKTANFAGGPTGYGKTTMNVKPMTGVPGMKTAAPAPTTATLPAGGGAGVKSAGGGLSKDKLDYINAINAKQPASLAEAQQVKRIIGALKKPLSEMLQMVETKEDVNSIKKFIDQTFTKYGAVNESAFAVRNKMIEHVTQVGAQRRREFARKG
jgi:LysM repeat protein